MPVRHAATYSRSYLSTEQSLLESRAEGPGRGVAVDAVDIELGSQLCVQEALQRLGRALAEVAVDAVRVEAPGLEEPLQGGNHRGAAAASRGHSDGPQDGLAVIGALPANDSVDVLATELLLPLLDHQLARPVEVSEVELGRGGGRRAARSGPLRADDHLHDAPGARARGDAAVVGIEFHGLDTLGAQVDVDDSDMIGIAHVVDVAVPAEKDDVALAGISPVDHSASPARGLADGSASGGGKPGSRLANLVERPALAHGAERHAVGPEPRVTRLLGVPPAVDGTGLRVGPSAVPDLPALYG